MGQFGIYYMVIDDHDLESENLDKNGGHFAWGGETSDDKYYSLIDGDIISWFLSTMVGVWSSELIFDTWYVVMVDVNTNGSSGSGLASWAFRLQSESFPMRIRMG